jgi:predicted RNA-binding protein
MIFNDINMKLQVEQLKFIRDKKDWSMRTSR